MATRPRLALLLALLAVLAFLPGMAGLRLDPGILSLLPAGDPAAREFRQVEELFGGLEQVFVLISRTDGEPASAQLSEAAARFATALTASPTVHQARADWGAELAGGLPALLHRAPLLLDGDWEATVRRRLEPAALEARARQIRHTLLSPLGSVGALLVHDPLGFAEELPLLQDAGAALPVDPLTGGILANDGGSALVLVQPQGEELDAASGQLLLSAIEAACRMAGEEVGVSLRCQGTGGPLYAAHDERILRRDISTTVWSSFAFCLLVLAITLDGWILALVSMVALLPALVWTGAMAHWTYGEVAAVGAGFAAVLIGLGIDYGVHGVVRFREATLAGAEPATAWRLTLRTAGPGILTSTLTTAAAFFALSRSALPPLRQLGGVVTLGILLTCLATWWVTGAVLLLLARRRSLHRRPRRLWNGLQRAVDLAVDAAGRHRRVVAWGVLLSLPLATLGILRLEFTADMRALRPADHPLREVERRLVEDFGIGLDTAMVAVPGADLDQALLSARRLASALRSAEGGRLQLTTPADVLVGPAEQARRLEVLERLPLDRAAATLEGELAAQGIATAGFAPGFAALRELAAGRAPGFDLPDIPGARPVSDATGRVWLPLHLRLPLEHWPDGPPAMLLERIREWAPGAALASAPRIGAAVRQTARRELAALGLLALTLVAAVILVSYRGRWRASLVALLPVLLGCFWTFGLLGACGVQLDLVSLALLPILIGIGVDDGLHAVHGARLDPIGGLTEGVRRAGRAMVITALTTAGAFDSLLLSHVPGLRSGGATVGVGVLACLAATFLVLPALPERWWRGRRI